MILLLFNWKCFKKNAALNQVASGRPFQGQLLERGGFHFKIPDIIPLTRLKINLGGMPNLAAGLERELQS